MKRVLTIPALLVAFPLVAQAPQSPAPEAPKAMSLQEAIETALKNNLQVGIAETTRDSAKANVLIEGGAFDWNLTGAVNWSRIQDASTNQQLLGGSLVTTGSESTTQSRNLSLGLNKPFEWGGTLNMQYQPTYRATKIGPIGSGSQGQTYLNTPPYDGTLSASYTQSLLRNFGREVAASRLIVAQNGAKIADLNYQKAIVDLVAATESLYWDVVYAKRNLENKQGSLALAEKQLKENEIRVQVGTLAPIEVTSAQAAVAQRQQDIISAEAQYLNAKDALSRALFPQQARTPIEPSESPKVSPLNVDEPAAERMALANRVELKAAKLDLEGRQILEKAANNRTLPQLDVSVGYTGNAANDPKLSPVNSDLTGMKYPGYNMGVSFAFPILNKGARGAQAQARANRRAGELGLKDAELGIVLEVRQALRTLDAAEKGVAAAEKTRIYREKNLEAEQKKFENGMSTNFFVLQRQDELDAARSAELQAQIGYAKAITAYEKAAGHLLEARKLSL